jgi:hypothetical protein
MAVKRLNGLRTDGDLVRGVAGERRHMGGVRVCGAS